MLILLLLIGGATVVIALNLFGFREDVLMPYLRGAPIIGGLFGEAEEDDDPLTGLSATELRRRYYGVIAERDALQRSVQSLQNELAIAHEDIRWLQWFQGRWEQYIYSRARLDQIIAHGAPEEFIEWFGTMHPDNLEALAVEILEVVAYNAELDEIVRTINQMEAALAGEALESLMMRDTQLMLTILRGMGITRRAEILDTLEYNIIATIVQLMAQQPPEFAQFDPPPQLEDPPHPSLMDTPPPSPPFTMTIPELPAEDDEYYDEDEEYEYEYDTEDDADDEEETD